MGIIIFFIILLVFITTLYLVYLKRLEKEFDENFEFILKQVKVFSEEFKNLTTHLFSKRFPNSRV